MFGTLKLAMLMSIFSLQNIPSISTPNYKDQDATNGIIANKKLESKDNFQISRNAIYPSNLEENVVRSREQIVNEFRKMKQMAQEQAFTSFLKVDLSKFSGNGCSAQDEHPSGVPRTKDGKLNGSTLIVYCDSIVIVFEVFDLSYSTDIIQKISLADGYKKIEGGYSLSAYGVTPSGKMRQSISVIAKKQSITATIMSNRPVPQKVANQKAMLIIFNIIKYPLEAM